VKRLALGLGSVAITGMFALLAARVTLVTLLLAAVPFLIWTALRRPDRMGRRSLGAAGLALVLTVLPVDLWVIRTGDLDMGVARVVWGLYRPLPEPTEPSGDVLSGGCARPLLNPVSFAVWVSY
jgi:hypothetical protein